MRGAVITTGVVESPNKRLRVEWGESLQEHMDAKKLTRKALVAEVARRGHKISVQAVGQWIRGETSPRPHMQSVLAAVFETPVRRLFPIEAAA